MYIRFPGFVPNNRFEQTITDVRAIIPEAMTGYSLVSKSVAMFETKYIGTGDSLPNISELTRDLVRVALHVT
jgi:hypothetical protein